MGTITRRLLAALLLSAGLVAAVAVPALSAVPAAPNTAVLTGIRTGKHPTFDRIVLDLSGPRPQVSSRFVTKLTQDGSGQTVPLPGTAFDAVQVKPAQAHDYRGSRNFRTANLTNVTAVAITGDNEGVLSMGIGMRKRTWVKVSTLTGPTRVVIDVGR